MVRLSEITAEIEKIAPKELAESWDNVGVSVGDIEQKVKRLYIALDLDENTLEDAIYSRCDAIITHHPILLKGVNKITAETAEGRIVMGLIKNNITHYAAHTNLDSAKGGLNDILASKLALENVVEFNLGDDFEGGRCGKIQPQKFGEFMCQAKENLGLEYIRYAGDVEKIVESVAVCSGGGGGFIKEVVGKADVYITGDVKYHEAGVAKENGLCVIDAGHFETENFVCEFFKNLIEEKFQKRGVECVVSGRKKSYLMTAK